MDVVFTPSHMRTHTHTHHTPHTPNPHTHLTPSQVPQLERSQRKDGNCCLAMMKKVTSTLSLNPHLHSPYTHTHHLVHISSNIKIHWRALEH